MSTGWAPANPGLGLQDIPAASFSFKSWVVINGTSYAAVQVVVTHNKFESRAVCELAVGVNTRDLNGLPAIPANFVFTRGLPAQVMIEVDEDLGAAAPVNDARPGYSLLLKKGTHTLFDGIVDDGGPTNLVKGRFNLNVVIVSKLLYLGTGSPQFKGLSTNVFGNGIFNDLNMVNNPAAMRGPTEAKNQFDFWAEMQNSYIRLTDLTETNLGSTTALSVFLERYGREKLTKLNSTVLNMIKGSLPAGVFEDTPMGIAVVEFYNHELLVDPVGQTVLKRIKAYAEDFFYALIENGYGYAVIPYTPFVSQSLIKTTIWPNTVYAAQWRSNSTAMLSGLAFIGCTGGDSVDMTSGQNYSDVPQASQAFDVLGMYKRPGVVTASNTLDPEGDSLGIIQCVHAPPWLTAALTDPDAMAKINEAFANLDQGIRRFGDPYAREIALKQTYGGRALIVDCPLRMDIGPCTPVKLIYPDIAGTGLSSATSPAVYGSVESVTIQLNAPDKKALTTLEIVYVRSQSQQQSDIDPGPFAGAVAQYPYSHPIWAGTYLGQRLDEAPDFQLTATPAQAVPTGSGGFTTAPTGNA